MIGLLGARGCRTAAIGVDIYAISLSKNEPNINFSKPSIFPAFNLNIELPVHTADSSVNKSHAPRGRGFCRIMYPFC